MVETGQMRVGAVVDQKEIDELPIDGRNFLDFSQTVAGVTDQQTSGQGSGLSFNGQRGRSNNISIDGADNNGQLNGNTRLTMSQDAVREFQVVTNMFAPEFGSAAGGLVNVVSALGHQRLSRRRLLLLRATKRWTGATPSSPMPTSRRSSARPKAPRWADRSIGNKTFFFAAVEYTKRHESGMVTISDASLAAHQRRAGAPSHSAQPGDGDRQRDLSHQPDRHPDFDQGGPRAHRQGLARASATLYGQDRQSNAGGVAIGGITDVSGGGGQRMRDQSWWSGSLTSFRPTLLLGIARSNTRRELFTQYANDPSRSARHHPGIATWGRSANFPVLLDEGRQQFTETVSKQAGRHFFKFGGDVELGATRTRPSPSISRARSPSPAWPHFVAGTVNTFIAGLRRSARSTCRTR